MKNKFVIYHLPAYLWAALIFIVSSLPVIVPRFAGRISDDICHFIEFAIFGLLLARSFNNAETVAFKKYFLLLTIIIGASYGVFDEYHQAFVPHRGFEIPDLLADWLGVLLGVIAYAKFIRGSSHV